MGRTYEVYIVTSAFFERKHDAGQFTGRHFPAFIQLAEAVVLTVDAFHVAVGEEYGARTALAGDRRLFASMGHVTVYYRVMGGPAVAEMAPGPVYTAFAGAYIALFQGIF